MINPNKLTIQKILLSFYMNLIPLPLMETLSYVIDIAKDNKDENVAINQAQFDEIKQFVCFFKFIW
jgi:hypothetical protein